MSIVSNLASNLVFKAPYIAGGAMGLITRGSYAVIGLGSIALYTYLAPRYVVNQVVTGYKKSAICLGGVKFATGFYEAQHCSAKDKDCQKESLHTVSEGIVDVLSGFLGEFAFEKIFDYVDNYASGDVFN